MGGGKYHSALASEEFLMELYLCWTADETAIADGMTAVTKLQNVYSNTLYHSNLQGETP